jgi:hypothetical protein
MLRESGKPARQRTSAFFSRAGSARTERNVSIIAIPLLHSVIVSFEQKNLGYLPNLLPQSLPPTHARGWRAMGEIP